MSAPLASEPIDCRAAAAAAAAGSPPDRSAARAGPRAVAVVVPTSKGPLPNQPAYAAAAAAGS